MTAFVTIRAALLCTVCGAGTESVVASAGVPFATSQAETSQTETSNTRAQPDTADTKTSAGSRPRDDPAFPLLTVFAETEAERRRGDAEDDGRGRTRGGIRAGGFLVYPSLADSVSEADQATIQGVNDTLVALVSTLCAFTAGVILSGFGWTLLALTAAVIPCAVIALLAVDRMTAASGKSSRTGGL